MLLNFDFHLRILIKPDAKSSLSHLPLTRAQLRKTIYFQIVSTHSRPIKPSGSADEDSLNVRNAEYGLKLAFDGTRSCVSFMTILLEKFTCFFDPFWLNVTLFISCYFKKMKPPKLRILLRYGELR